MSEMMFDAEGRPVRGTLFEYNDNPLNNVGTFVTNELLGFDDWQRAFGDWDRGDVSFWDRAKSVGAGLGELGGTLALLVPGANVAAAASKIPKVGMLASRAVPLVSPMSRGEQALGGGILGLGATSAALPEDSPLQSLILPATAAALGGYGGAKFIRGRRASSMGAAPSTTPIPPSALQTPVTGQRYTQPVRTLPGVRLSGAATTSQATATTAPAAAEAVSRARRYNPLVSPRTGQFSKGRAALLAGGGLAAWAALQALMGGEAAPQAVPGLSPEYIAQLNEQMRMDPTTAAMEAANARYDELMRMGQQQFSGDDEYSDRARQATAQYLSSLMNYGDARSPALQQAYQRVAGALGGVQAGETMGAAGRSIEQMYGRQARRSMREGRQAGGPAGESPTGGLVPVDATLQEAAQAMRQEGGSLADWLGEYGSITDRLLAERAAAAGQRGRREAQYLQDQIAMQAMADERNLELALAEREAARQEAMRNWMFDLESNRMSTMSELENAALAAQIERQAALTPQSVAEAQMTWESLDDATRASFAQYGIVDAPTYINYALLGQLPPAPTVG